METQQPKIPNGWIKTNLFDGDYFDIVKSGIEKFSGEKKYLSTSSIDRDKIVNIEAMVSFDNRHSRANMLPVDSSVWFAKMKNTIKVTVADQDMENSAILSTGFFGVIPKKDKVLSSYLKQIFLSDYFNNLKDNNSTGSTMQGINNNGIQKIDILLPSLVEQKKITAILSAVDKKIEKNDEIVLQTEKLKKGLMQDLFTKGIGHKKFKKTEVGPIPEEWEISKLSEIAKVERGKFSHRPRNAPEFYGGSIPFIQTGDVVNSNGKISSYTQTLNEKGLSVSRLFKKGTIVITIAANIGDTGILQFDSCFPDSLIGITPSEKINPIFLEYYLRTKKEYLNSISTQSAQKNINLEKLNPLLIKVPPKNEQKKIAEILSSTDEKILMNTKYGEKLNRLKKGLMQDLLSGKVRTRPN